MFHDKGKRKRITRRAYFLQRLVLEQELEVGMQVFAGACGNFPRRRWLSRPACRPAGGKWSDRHRTQRPLPSAGQRLLCVLLLDSTMATATRRRTEECTTSTTSTLATCSVIPKIHVCLLLHAVLFTTAKRRKMSSTMSTCSHNSHYYNASVFAYISVRR